jgi:hypothetical protein
MRTRIMNQLQALAMNEGQRRKKKLWNEQGRAQLEKLPLATRASRRRQDLLELLDRMNPTIGALTAAVVGLIPSEDSSAGRQRLGAAACAKRNARHSPPQSSMTGYIRVC